MDNLGIPVSAVTADDEKSAFCALGNGKEDGSDEGFAVVRLLEDGDLLAKTRSARPMPELIREHKFPGLRPCQHLLLVSEGLELDFFHHVGNAGNAAMVCKC